MQYIAKGPEPPDLTNWRQGQIDAGIVPRYDDLKNPEKSHCREQLLAEQGTVCCYCNRRIAQDSMHIEHLVPQSVDDTLDLVWTNLLGCCAPQNQKGNLRSQAHCGEFRQDRALGVTPLDPTCGDQFEYTLQGQVAASPQQNAAAIQTVENLNLTAERLRVARASLVEEAYLDLEQLSEPDWLATYVERDTQEGFPEFAGMMRWFYETSWRAEQQLLQG